MSEKRFIVDSDFVEYPKLVDTHTNCFYHIADDIRNVEIFCERLNKLIEGNEQLRYDNFMFKGVIETFQKVAISERKKLEKENEQLKKELKWKREEIKALIEESERDE